MKNGLALIAASFLFVSPAFAGSHAVPNDECVSRRTPGVVAGIQYTGKGCLRVEGVCGEEGYDSNGRLGCWKH